MKSNFLIFFTLSQLYRSRVHLGVQSTYLNTNAFRYLLPIKSKFSVFDLNYSAILLKSSFHFLSYILEKRGSVLIINENKILVDFIKSEFDGIAQPISYENWPSGLLSNFKAVRNNSLKAYFLKKQFIVKLFLLDSVGLLNSKTRNIIKSSFNFLKFKKELNRYIKYLNRLPNCIFVLDSLLSSIAINEAQRVGIVSLGICDSNADNFNLNYSIPANSTSIKSVLLYLQLLKLIFIKGILNERLIFFNKCLTNKKKFLGLNFLLSKSLKVNDSKGVNFYKLRGYYAAQDLFLNPYLSLFNKNYFSRISFEKWFSSQRNFLMFDKLLFSYFNAKSNRLLGSIQSSLNVDLFLLFSLSNNLYEKHNLFKGFAFYKNVELLSKKRATFSLGWFLNFYNIYSFALNELKLNKLSTKLNVNLFDKPALESALGRIASNNQVLKLQAPKFVTNLVIFNSLSRF